MEKKEEPYCIDLLLNNVGPFTNSNIPFKLGTKGETKTAVFAMNGTGKSTLSKQFRLFQLFEDLTEGQKLPHSNKYLTLGQSQGSLKFTFKQSQGEGKPQYQKKAEIKYKLHQAPTINNESDFIFHVFNSDYVRDTIAPKNYQPDQKIDGYIISKTAVDVSKEELELAERKEKRDNLETIIAQEIQDEKNRLKKLGISSNTIEFKNITVESVLNEHLKFKEKESYDVIKNALLKLKNIPDTLNDIPELKPIHGFDISWLAEMRKQLVEIVSPSTIAESFIEKVQKKESFVKEGVEQFKVDQNNCPFCEQKLQEKEKELILQYVEYIEDAETKHRNQQKEFSRKLDKLKKTFESVSQDFLKCNRQFENVRKYFPSFNKKEFSFPSEQYWYTDYTRVLASIGSKIDAPDFKIPNTDLECSDNFIASVNHSVQTELPDLIEKNNKLIQSLNKSKNNSHKELLTLRRRLCNSALLRLKNQLFKEITAHDSICLKIKTLEQNIEQLKAKNRALKKEVIKETFGLMLTKLFGDKYSYNPDNNCLSLKTGQSLNSTDDVLSDGEKSLIAFCYYIAETHRLVDKEEDYNKLFFIIDDPVSSMDFHLVYSVANIIKNLEYQFDKLDPDHFRLILFTHNVEFLSILIRNKAFENNAYSFVNNKFNPLNKELVMPYHGHLIDVYSVAKGKSYPSHTTPNSIRHILETIKKFESPGKNNSLDRFIDNSEELKTSSSLVTLMQDGSHGYYRSQPATTDEAIKAACEAVIRFVSNRYKGQIENIKRAIK